MNHPIYIHKLSPTELLLVRDIIRLPSGIIYDLMAPSRVKAKQTTIRNLRQIYTASSHDGADHEGGPIFNLIGGHVSLQPGSKLLDAAWCC